MESSSESELQGISEQQSYRLLSNGGETGAAAFIIRFISDQRKFSRSIYCPFSHVSVVDEEITNLLKQPERVSNIELRFGEDQIIGTEILTAVPRRDLLSHRSVGEVLRAAGLTRDEVSNLSQSEFFKAILEASPNDLNEQQIRAITIATNAPLRAKVVSFDTLFAGLTTDAIRALFQIMIDRLDGSRQVFLLSYSSSLPSIVLNETRVALLYSAKTLGSAAYEPDVKQNIRDILRNSTPSQLAPAVMTFPQFLPIAGSTSSETVLLEKISNPDSEIPIEMKTEAVPARKRPSKDTLTGIKRLGYFQRLSQKRFRGFRRSSDRWPSQEMLMVSTVPSEQRREQARRYEAARRTHKLVAVALMLLLAYLFLLR